MKQRILALDGVRGLAALSVVFTHLDEHIVEKALGPVFTPLFHLLASGTVAVQAFFVLTGFLLVSLYDAIPDPLQFLKKRYLRIFPAFLLFTIYYWFVAFYPSSPIFIDVLVLLVLIITGYRLIVYTSTKRFSYPIGTILLISFLLLQGITAMVLFAIQIPKLHVLDTSLFHPALTLIANATLTAVINPTTPLLSSVFWSLVLEVLFYISFPFMILPIVRTQKKYGLIFLFIVSLGFLKISMDIQQEGIIHRILVVLHFSRISGFICGVTLGALCTAYKDSVWVKLQKITSHPFCSGILILILGIALYLERTFREQVTYSADIYYLIVSSVVGLIIVAALTNGSLIEKFLSRSIWTFLGKISFSLYLSHQIVLALLAAVTRGVQGISLFPYVYLACSIFFSILLAWISYTFIEHPSLTRYSISSTILRRTMVYRPRVYLVCYFLYCVLVMFLYLPDVPRRQLIISEMRIPAPQHALRYAFTLTDNQLASTALAISAQMMEPNNLQRTSEVVQAQLLFYDVNNKFIAQTNKTLRMQSGKRMYTLPLFHPTRSSYYMTSVSIHPLYLVSNTQVLLSEPAFLVSSPPTFRINSFIWNRLAYQMKHRSVQFALLFPIFVIGYAFWRKNYYPKA